MSKNISAIFSESAQAFKLLTQSATEFFNKLSESQDFAYNVSQNDTVKVKQLLQSIGSNSNKRVDVKYNPDEIALTMYAQVKNTDCCKLTMPLRWR